VTQARDPHGVQALPSGDVTFVFTDVEGSTRLLHELGAEEYARVLAEHRRTLREAFAGCAASRSTPSATRSSTRSHRPPPRWLLPPRFRSSLCACASAFTAGLPSSRTQATSAHLASNTVLLLPLGEHRLKDFERPVALFQLGGHSFPPLRTIANTNLPRPTSSFVGREREVRDVVELVRANRFVTLTGPGGSGKTRLAGVFWIPLAAVREPALVLETVAQTLGARESLSEHLGERQMLLALDNLEQVVDAAPDLAALVEACSNLGLLVTSRERVHVRGEVEYEVLPLAQSDAVELFSARGAVEPSAAVPSCAVGSTTCRSRSSSRLHARGC
jgi:hypothetical protein